jgi:hypothetical protein
LSGERKKPVIPNPGFIGVRDLLLPVEKTDHFPRLRRG